MYVNSESSNVRTRGISCKVFINDVDTIKIILGILGKYITLEADVFPPSKYFSCCSTNNDIDLIHIGDRV